MAAAAPSRPSKMIWSLVISNGTPMASAQAIITTKAMVRVMVVERSTPKRRATTAVSRLLTPSVTAVIIPNMAPISMIRVVVGSLPWTEPVVDSNYSRSWSPARPAAPAAPATLEMSVVPLTRCGIQLTIRLNIWLSR